MPGLWRCNLTEKSCSYLASALTSHSSSLRQLNLSEDVLLDSGVECLCFALCHQNCKLEELQLMRCNLTEKSCSHLASALTSHSSSLRLLDLSDNDLLDSGFGLNIMFCTWLTNCKLTEKSCSYLVSALTSHSSSLRQLNLRANNLRKSTVEQLSALVEDPHCKLEKLELWNCELTDMSCSYLASALSTHSSNLRVLILEGNKEISKSAVEQFSALVEDPHCKLERLESNWGTIERSSIQTPTSVLSAECLGRNMSMSPASSSSRETASS
ncbi:hypothetical protein AALO_G00091270 [Alosa alosa]|uniref:Uncharacterized protein n=1 Tax=Alosa alosa TaxID=278164 RepID=A0AAV6GWL9_9TELE|nr:hypothetical protein AALO_G00091270 [Alosa alosa]